jgi:hypothetical protein
MGWRIVFVDEGGNLRNGGYTKLKAGSMAEDEARDRAARHNELVSNRSDRVMNVVCVSDQCVD